jgi:hypothetical protein
LFAILTFIVPPFTYPIGMIYFANFATALLAEAKERGKPNQLPRYLAGYIPPSPIAAMPGQYEMQSMPPASPYGYPGSTPSGVYTQQPGYAAPPQYSAPQQTYSPPPAQYPYPQTQQPQGYAPPPPAPGRY